MAFSDAYQSLIDFDIKNDSKKNGDKKVTKRKDSAKHEDARKRSRSRSPKQKVEPKNEEINYDVPSRQFGDLYCVVCDSHMNSEQMWENHIKGRRHLKSSSKGDPSEQKYEYCDDEPTVQKEFDKETRPIAGLDHICEILRIKQTPIYQCFLCSASITTSKLLMEHIMGLKHQMAFLKEHDKEKFALVDSSALSKAYLEPIVQDLISKYEQEHGRGKMTVKKEKEKAGSSFSYKKSGGDGDKKHASSKSRHSPPPKPSRYSSPPKSSRYSPSRPSRRSPPPKSSRYSPPPKSSRMKERNSESEWMRVSPVQERLREIRYPDRSLYSEEEWKRIEPEPTCYRRTNLDTDSRLDYGHGWPSDADYNNSDLRVILEQKKNLGMTSASARANMDVLPSVSVPSESNNVSDSLLRLIDDMSPEVFLSLALFKLDNMSIRDEIELKLLDRVANKATGLSLDIKKKISSPDLKAKFKESLAQNGISSQGNSMVNMPPQSNIEFTQNLENLIGHYKARKSTVYDDVHSNDSPSNRLTSPEQYIDRSSSHHPLNASPQYRNNQERAPSYDSEWNQRSSASSFPFSGFSSTTTNIPGLTLTEEPLAAPSTSTVMSQFAQTAKNIFGSINVPSTPTNPYQSEDYNRLNYRY